MSHVSLPIIVIGKIGVQILVSASRSYTFNRYATLFCCYKNWVISRLFCQVSEIIYEHSGNIKIHYEGYSPLKLLISSHFFTYVNCMKSGILSVIWLIASCLAHSNYSVNIC